MRTIKIMHEEHMRSAIKTLSWRIVSTASTMLVALIITGRLDLTLGIGMLDIFLRTPLYFFHERAWNRIQYGKTLKGAVESAVRVPPVTVSLSETVSNVINGMVVSDIGAVIVVDENGGPAGLVTERDILERVVEANKEPSQTYAKDIMSSPVATVERGESLINTLRIMRDKEIRRLAVTDNGKLVGIITERRLLEALI
jgi:CBS domain-containing protein